MNVGKRQYLRYLSNRVSLSINIITEICAQTTGSNIEGVSEEDRKIILRALSDSITPLGTIVEYIDRETKEKKVFKEITVHLKFNLDEEDESGNVDDFIRDDLVGKIARCANQYEIGDIDIETKEVKE
jgi:hypothetical protein